MRALDCLQRYPLSNSKQHHDKPKIVAAHERWHPRKRSPRYRRPGAPRALGPVCALGALVEPTAGALDYATGLAS
jgi:hypothetical protein